MTIDNRQNDLIKDNIKDNNKEDNNKEALTASAVKSSIGYPVITVSDLVSNGIEYELIEGSKDLIRIKQTNKIVRVI